MNQNWRYVPARNWDRVCLHKSIGFIHIPRTGGTYLSKKLWLGIWDPWTWKHGLVDHKLPSIYSLKERDHWFTIVRNPYNRIISELLRFKKPVEFLLESNQPPKQGHFAPQKNFVEFSQTIIHYETMDKEINEMMKSLNLPLVDFSDWSPRTHNLTDKEKFIISQVYKEDFELLGYSF